MSTKTFISILLIPLFLGKLLIVDASLLNILAEDEISFVKPYCQKKQSNSDIKKTYEFKQNLDAKNNITEVSSFCTPQFNFNVFSWNFNISEVINIEDILFSSRLSYLYLDSHSPPPKFV
ncbi:hypothetical protein [Christiangramia crocea]|uniref:Uncharacterized protein n=1 Tax=Christiangramia crocea TaxID=2904124 RepID=A0A9X1UXH4_9FLAO|nr:hypothetical protein [Gramella crocea]MCG9972162.1 hypothetical protein [Gramella crocea]